MECLLSAALPNSHHGLHSLLATMAPINDPAEHLLMIRQVEMTRKTTVVMGSLLHHPEQDDRGHF